MEVGEATRLSTEVCVLQISPLLRELVVAAAMAEPEYQPDSPESRIMAVILDQIGVQPVATLALPMPTEARVLRIVRYLIANPGDSRELGAWAREVGASKQTLTRLFLAQTGMTFRSWREQLRVLSAMELLATGDSVTNVALEVDYGNTSALIAMFRRCLGTTPARYLDIAGQ
jgi:AraC-like DNA-binding protein